MKLKNKKGFTLAELLIVIAIIAILIGIAIPAFSASLDSAKLATDHANIRSAYSIYQSAKMLNVIDLGTGTGTPSATGTTNYYFCKDGTIQTSQTNAYKTQVGVKAADVADKCASSLGCVQIDATEGTKKAHPKDAVIKISYNATTKEWSFCLDGGTTP